LEALEKALKGRKKAAEELSESVSDVLSSAKYLKDALASVAAVLPADTLVDASLLDAIQKKNDRKAGNKPSPTNAAPVATGSKGGEQDPTPAPYGLGRPSSTVPKEREPPPAPRAAPARRAAPSPTDQADDAEDERLRKQREQWQAEAEREQRKAEPEKGRRRDNDIERLLDTHTVGKKPKGDDADPFQ
jgi:hypothetical protein